MIYLNLIIDYLLDWIGLIISYEASTSFYECKQTQSARALERVKDNTQ